MNPVNIKFTVLGDDTLYEMDLPFQGNDDDYIEIRWSEDGAARSVSYLRYRVVELLVDNIWVLEDFKHTPAVSACLPEDQRLAFFNNTLTEQQKLELIGVLCDYVNNLYQHMAKVADQ